MHPGTSIELTDVARMSAFGDDPDHSETTRSSHEEDGDDFEVPRAIGAVAKCRVSNGRKALYISAWLLLNLCLTMFNKIMLGQAHLPWLLTSLHTSATTIGCLIWLALDRITLHPLGVRKNLLITGFSVLFTSNVGVSNAALAVVSVPLHQIMRSTCPVVTILIYRSMQGQKFKAATYLSMIPLVVGVGLATTGDYDCNLAGFSLNVVGVVLSSIKAVATSRLMSGYLALSTAELLLRISPLSAVQCLAFAFLSGETEQFRTLYCSDSLPPYFGSALVGNALLAVLLNMVSFQANKAIGALAMTVAGNLKQVLTIVLGSLLFRVRTGAMSAIGMLIATVGAVWYCKLELENQVTRTGS